MTAQLRSTLLISVFVTALLGGAAGAELVPEWIRYLPAGASLTAGTQGFTVDAAGNSYITGIAGSSSNTDIATASFAPDGSPRWSNLFDGPAGWHDQSHAVALGGDGHLYVAGNTPGPGMYANLLLLEYESATGEPLDTLQLEAGLWASEHGAWIAAGADGVVYVVGGTTGDGGDALVIAFDANGSELWRDVWDGPAWAPYSQDSARKAQLDVDGDLVVMLHGVMASNHPDYVIRKYAGATGEVLWQASWGVNGGDSPRDMELDALGDVYVTGTAIDGIDKYSTIKLRGSDGGLLWQRYDAVAAHHSASALALDGSGGVYITGAADPDGDESNSNDNFFTVKRDAASGDLVWSHGYGANCLWCYDVPSDLIVDSAGHLFIAGTTSSPPYSSDALLLVLDSASGVEIDRGVVTSGTAEAAGTGILALDGAENVYDGADTLNYDTGELRMSVTRWPSRLESVFRDAFEAGLGAWDTCAP